MEGKPVQLKGVIAQEGGHDVGRAARDHDRSDSRNNSLKYNGFVIFGDCSFLQPGKTHHAECY